MKPEEVYSKNILIASLNWGFGHLTRDIGIIRLLLKNKNKIYFAGNEEQQEILKQYFPEINYLNLPGYDFQFKGKGEFAKDILNSTFKLRKNLKLEKSVAKNFIDKFSIDIIISDHRYGFFNENITSIFITHQINLPLKFWQRPFQILHNNYLSKFDFWWIPDTENNMFAGKLSRTKNVKAIFIGPQSRFEKIEIEKENSCAVIASGPIIYAAQFIKNINLEALFAQYDKVYFLGNFNLDSEHEKLEKLNFQKWVENDLFMSKVSKIYSRSGYSTIMDLHFLGCEKELFPTPGQAEQEYLFELNSGLMQ